MSQPGFWGDQQQANKIMTELKQLKATQEPWLFINKELGSVKELAAVVEEKDTSSLEELRKDLSGLDSKVKELEFKTLMSGENDPNNAILSINAGAGGTEACDWVAMLFRMYKRWAEKHGYKIKVLDYLQGEKELVIEGQNVTVCVSPDTFLKKEIPEWLRKALTNYMEKYNRESPYAK